LADEENKPCVSGAFFGLRDEEALNRGAAEEGRRSLASRAAIERPEPHQAIERSEPPGN
jgi:hypothetical protein